MSNTVKINASVQHHYVEIEFPRNANMFTIVPFVDMAIQKMQLSGKITKVNVWEDSITKCRCADITEIDAGGMERKHRYMDSVRSVRP